MKPVLQRSSPLPFSFVIHEACKQLVKLLASVLLAACLLHASKSVIGSLPLAILLVAAAEWHFRHRPGGGARQPQHHNDFARDILQGATALISVLWLLLDYTIGALFGGDGHLSWHLPATAEAGAPAFGQPPHLRPRPQKPQPQPQAHPSAEAVERAQHAQHDVQGGAYGSKLVGSRAGGQPPTSAAVGSLACGDIADPSGGGVRQDQPLPTPPPYQQHQKHEHLHHQQHQQEHQQRLREGRPRGGSPDGREQRQQACGGGRTRASRLSYEFSHGTTAGAGGGGSGAAASGLESHGRVVDRDAWRAQVGSKVVEFAWEKLCGGIVQTWVYDVWWALLSPDREFPAEVRRLLNAAFGRLAERARRLDVGAVLVRDVCEALISTLELYRSALEHLGGEQQLEARALRHAAQNMAMAAPSPPPPLGAVHYGSAASGGVAGSAGGGAEGGDGSPTAAAAAAATAVAGARERLLQGGLRAVGGLHPAFEEPDGHYRALRGAADAMLDVLWSDEPLCCGPQLRPLLREMMATCVLRPIMMFASPVTINRVLHATLPQLPDEAPLAPAAPAPVSANTASTATPAAAAAAALIATGPAGSRNGAGSTATAATVRSPSPLRARYGTAGPSTATGTGQVRALSPLRFACGPSPPRGPSPARGGRSSHPGSSGLVSEEPADRRVGGGGAVRTPPPTPTEVAARAAAEFGQEFERRAAANAAAETALLQRLARSHGSADGHSAAYPHQQHHHPYQAQHAELSDHPHRRHEHQHQQQRPYQHQYSQPNPQPHAAAQSSLRAKSGVCRTDRRPRPPAPLSWDHGSGGGGGGAVRKSTSTMDLRASASGAAAPPVASSPAASTDEEGASPLYGGDDGRQSAPIPRPASGADTATSTTSTAAARGLSASYHAGMDHPESTPASGPNRLLDQLPPSHQGAGAAGGRAGTGGARPLGASAGANPEHHRGGGSGGGDWAAETTHLGPVAGTGTRPGRAIHRRSCSFDAAAARSGGGGGDANGSGGDAGTVDGGGGGGRSGPFTFRSSWFDFDLTSSFNIPGRKRAPPPAPPSPPTTRRPHAELTNGLAAAPPPLTQNQQQRKAQKGQAGAVEAPAAAATAPAPPPASVAGGWRPRASVAAFEMVSEPLGFGLTAEYVVYKIRVADAGTGEEWTVARRFRSFEALATKLAAAHPRHRSRVQALPPKRIFIHTADVSFVNSRRADLDAYLQQLLAVPELAGSGVLREFLLPDGVTAPNAATSQQQQTQAQQNHARQPNPPRVASPAGDASHAHQEGSSPAGRSLFDRVAADFKGLRRRVNVLGGLAPPTASVGSSDGGGSDGGGGGSGGFGWLGRGRGAAAAAAPAVQSGSAAAADRRDHGGDQAYGRPPAEAEVAESRDVENEEFERLLVEGVSPTVDSGCGLPLAGAAAAALGSGSTAPGAAAAEAAASVSGGIGGFRLSKLTGLLGAGRGCAQQMQPSDGGAGATADAGGAGGGGGGGGSDSSLPTRFTTVLCRPRTCGAEAEGGAEAGRAAAHSAAAATAGATTAGASPPSLSYGRPAPVGAETASRDKAAAMATAAPRAVQEPAAAGIAASKAPLVPGAGADGGNGAGQAPRGLPSRPSIDSTTIFNKHNANGGTGGYYNDNNSSSNNNNNDDKTNITHVNGNGGGGNSGGHAASGAMPRAPATAAKAAAAGPAAAAAAGPRIAVVPSTPIAAPPTGPHPNGTLLAPVAVDGLAAAAGISAPLYELVDVLFGLHGQGFIRRQVIAVTRQLLSLLAGDAIDTYVAHQLRHLTSEHSLARAILLLHGALFPGGAWYSFGTPPPPPPPLPQRPPHPPPPQPPPQPQQHHHQQQQQQSPKDVFMVRGISGNSGGGAVPTSGGRAAPAPVAAAAAATPPATAAVPRWRPSPPISAEAYLEPAVVPPDAVQVSERVRARLFSRPPAVLVNLVGARGYTRVLGDVWGLLQSRTLVLHLAYTLLHTLLVRLFPELQPRLRHLQPPGLRCTQLKEAAGGAQEPQ